MRSHSAWVIGLAAVLGGCAGAESERPADPAGEVAASPTPVSTSEAPRPAASTAAPTATAEPAPKPLTRPAEPLNVIIILVDSMRADMPWAGYPRKIAPVLTELESQSVSYTRGYSLSSYTAKSVAGMLAGQYPSSLKRSGYFFTKYPESNLFFPEVLQKAGAHTMSAHGHMYMKRGNGMDQGFDRWDVVDGISFDNSTDKHVTSQKLTPLAIDMLDKMPKDKQFFMYLHYMDPHDQYVTHEESPKWGTKPRDRYDSEMFYTDLWIGKLLDYAKKQPWWGKTAVIVSADHGEAFGEHKARRHAFAVWDVLTQVPLFFHVPGAKPRRIETPRGHIDMAPTVIDLMGLPPTKEFVGKSLVPELYGAVEPETRPVLLDLPVDSNNPERRAMIHGDYKLMVYGRDYRFDLFNLKEDPGELKDLDKVEKEKFEEMKALYKKTWDAVPKVAPYGGNKLINGRIANGPKD